MGQVKQIKTNQSKQSNFKIEHLSTQKWNVLNAAKATKRASASHTFSLDVAIASA